MFGYHGALARSRLGAPASTAQRQPLCHVDRHHALGTGIAVRGLWRESSHVASAPNPPHDKGTVTLSHKAKLAVVSSMAAALLLGAPPSNAITTEQLLFLEAWRAVDRAYVDKTFNGQTWFRVRENYLRTEPMEEREQTYAAIRKLLNSLGDPFTRFLDESHLSAVRRNTSGSLIGVGVELSLNPDVGPEDTHPMVVAPTAGGPAEVAGVRAGDLILAVDGKPTKGVSLYEASDMLLGAAGTQVTLTMQPHSGGPQRDLTLERRVVSVNPVTWQRCAGVPGGGASVAKDVGYIRIATFNSRTPPAFKEALRDLQAQGVGGLLLDLRNNGGGLFPASVEIARNLISTGDIVLIADSSGVRDVYSADNSALDNSTPLVVLVNKGTASASEVLAGALKDNGRARIAGENTFGKGLIQTIVDLSDGSGVVVTVARYQTPGGVDINKIGILPDVRLPSDALPAGGVGICDALTAGSAPALFG